MSSASQDAESTSENSESSNSLEDVQFDDMLSDLNAYFHAGKTCSFKWRRAQLTGAIKMFKENDKRLKDALYQDLGKCHHESFVTEIAYVISDVKHALNGLKRWMKPVRKSSPVFTFPAKSYLHPEPLGTVLIIGAWNYPLQLTLSPLIAAIAAGNCVVVKPSELASNTSSLIAELLPKYLDPQAINVVEGAKDETTALLTLPFDKIFYTGGEHVAKVVMRAASEHLTPVTLELGGKSPCVVDSTTDIDIAANRIVWGKWMNAGQTCIAPDFLLVEQACLDEFVEALKKAIVKQYSAEPKNSNEYGRIVNQRHCQRLASYLNEQDVIFGGQIDLQARYISPTLVLNPLKDSLLMKEEIFGPILPILAMPTTQHILDFIKVRPKPLATYLFTKNEEFESTFVSQVSAGSICINDTMMFMGNPELPFGGVGKSGMGRYHGKYGFDTFSHEKSVMKRSFLFENNIRYAPFTWFKRFIIGCFTG